MAASVDEADVMVAACEEHGVFFNVGTNRRWDPGYDRMKELIDSKAYGDVFQLSIWTEQLTRREEAHFSRSADQLVFLQFFSHGCHYVALMLWMLGRPIRGSHFGTNRSTPWMEREGTSNVTIEFEDGILGYHFGTWGARGTRLKYSFHAHCDGGMIEAAISDGKLIAHSRVTEHVAGKPTVKQKEEVLLEIQNSKPTEVEMAHFIDCIETGAKPLTDPVGSLEGLQVIWKLYEAEEKKEMADLNGLGLGTYRT